jgi:uncharacterized damage-inducible protein DinB
MDVTALLRELAAGPATVRALVGNLPTDAVHARPASDQWSVRDVLCHLLDEERYDFRARLDATLRGEPWPENRPSRQVALVEYAKADPAATLDAWEVERHRSMAWLASLKDPDWDATHVAPWGPIRAGDVLASWPAHDALHLRQIVRLRFRRIEALGAPYGVRYAGEW